MRRGERRIWDVNFKVEDVWIGKEEEKRNRKNR